MKRWYGLLRHGPTQWNLDKKIQGHQDVPLGCAGVYKVQAWAEHLAPLQFDHIVTSPLSRALDTADIMGRALKIKHTCMEAFIEQDFGVWEGQTLNEIEKNSPGSVQAQESMGWQFTPPRGESRMAVYERASAALASVKIEFPNKKILIVSHNSLIKTLVYHAMGSDFMPKDSLIKRDHLHLIHPTLEHGKVLPNALNLSGAVENKVNHRL